MQRALQILILAAIVSAFARFVAVPAYSAWTAPRPTIVDGEFVFDTFTAQEMRHTFRIRNEGKSPTTVTGVFADCGCTSLVRELVGTTLAAGEEIGIPVAVDVSAVNDHLEKSIRLQFSQGSPAQLRLLVKGRLRPFWDVMPTDVTLSPDNLSEHILIRPAAGAPTVRPATVISNHPDIDVNLTASTQSANWALDVHFAGALTTDRDQGFVFVEPDGIKRTISIPIKLIAE